MYVIVLFIDDGTFELAPSFWLREQDNCVWPPPWTKPSLVSKYIKQRSSPAENWVKHKVKILGRADNFDEGRKKARKAQFESDLSSDPSEYGKGKRKRKFAASTDSVNCFDYATSSSEEDSASLLDMLPSPPPPPRPVLSQISSPSEQNSLTFTEKPPPINVIECPETSSLFFTEDENVYGSNAPHSKLPIVNNVSTNIIGLGWQPTPRSRLKNASNNSIASKISHSQSTLHNNVSANSIDSQASACSEPSTLADTLVNLTTILKSVLRELKVIKHTQKVQEETLELILQQKRCKNDELSNPGPNLKIKVPVGNEELLDQLNLLLQNQEHKNELFIRLKSLGGHDFKDHTRRALRLIMPDSVAEKHSWAGNKDKRRFQCSAVSDLIIEAVHCASPQAMISEIEEVMKTWIRHAKERRLYQDKKK